jgi:hypothetical protein
MSPSMNMGSVYRTLYMLLSLSRRKILHIIKCTILLFCDEQRVSLTNTEMARTRDCIYCIVVHIYTQHPRLLHFQLYYNRDSMEYKNYCSSGE